MNPAHDLTSEQVFERSFQFIHQRETESFFQSCQDHVFRCFLRQRTLSLGDHDPAWCQRGNGERFGAVENTVGGPGGEAALGRKEMMKSMKRTFFVLFALLLLTATYMCGGYFDSFLNI